MLRVGEYDDPFDRLELVEDTGNDIDAAEVDEEEAVLGVVDHVDQLLWEEPGVYRVQDRTHARDAEERLEVARMVPRDPAHALTGLDAEAGERLGQAPRARVRLAVIGAVDRPLDVARDDLHVAKIGGGVFED